MTAQGLSQTKGLLLSGGLDSSIILHGLLADGHDVQPIYMRGGLVWEVAELRAAKRLVRTLASPRLRQLVVLNMPLEDVYEGHWSLTGRNVPPLESPDEDVFLPGRNLLLLLKAALWCQMRGVRSLAVGCLSTSPFADAGEEFCRDFESLAARSGGREIEIFRPLADLDKVQVLQMGRTAPLAETFSCLSPVDDHHCGRCNKCGERRRAFVVAGLPDPTHYAMAAAKKQKKSGGAISGPAPDKRPPWD